jgi:AraC family transcriptional activator of mtrCDE
MSHAASLLLLETGESIAAIALAVGYRSEFAFNRAFRRHHGIAPGGFRRRVLRVHEATESCLRFAA